MSLCPDCVRRIPSHGFHLCHPVQAASAPLDVRTVRHAKVLREAGATWDDVGRTLGVPKKAIRTAVIERYGAAA